MTSVKSQQGRHRPQTLPPAKIPQPLKILQPPSVHRPVKIHLLTKTSLLAETKTRTQHEVQSRRLCSTMQQFQHMRAQSQLYSWA